MHLRLSWRQFLKPSLAGDDEANARRSRTQRPPYGINHLLKQT